MNLCDPIFNFAAEHPEHPALIEDEQRLSFRQLAEKISQWGAGLEEAGLRSGDHVGICLRDTADFVLAILAAAHRGITFVPLDWRMPPGECARIATHFDTRLILTEAGRDTLPDVPGIAVNDDWRRECSRFDNSTAPIVAGDLPLALKLSSGTTGTPKGAIATHSGMHHRLARNSTSLKGMRNLTYLSVLPLCFSGGSNFVLFNLMQGNTVVLYPPLFSIDEFLDAIRRYRVNFTFAVPTILRWLLDYPSDRRPLLPELQALVTSTAPIAADEKRAVAARICPNFIEYYSTSAAGQISALLPEDLADHADSVGRPNEQLEFQIVDAEDRPLPVGETGRIRCRGPGCSESYYGNPDQSDFSEKLIGGWCYSGDLGRLSPDGFLYLEGRADELIIRGGVNIQPGAIEQVLLQHPDVVEAAVKGRASVTLGQEPVAYVVTRGGIGPEALQVFCRSRLSPEQVPVEVRLLPSLPKTAAGKIQKHKLDG